MLHVSFEGEQKLIVFGIILLRCMLTLMHIPLFDNSSINTRIKVFFSFLFSYAFYNNLSPVIVNDLRYTGIENFALVVLFHLSAALMIGYLVKAILEILISAGSIISQSIGFGTVNIFDPTLGKQVSPIERMLYWVLVILVLHYQGLSPMFKGVIYSFSKINLVHFTYSQDMVVKLMDVFINIFLSCILLATPFMFMNLVMMFLLGVMARVAPQVNVLIMSFSISIVLGAAVFFITNENLVIKILEDYVKYIGVWYNLIIT